MTREKISINFYRDEFACKCDYGCGADTVDIMLDKILENLREYLCLKYKTTVYVTIISGNRCHLHNADTPGATDDSYHLYGQAADFTAHYRDDQGKKIYVDSREIGEHLNSRYPNKYGIGVYADPNRNHVDCGFRKWRNWE